MYHNDHIASLGYRLEATSDPSVVRPLLDACGLGMVEDTRGEISEYLMATTAAGGIAACVGWTRLGEERAVLHSLAVAPPSRGSGVGASLMATALACIMDGAPVEAIYLCTAQARRFFALYGFVELEQEDVPAAVNEHEAFASAGEGCSAMVRHYQLTPRGLDQCAFRLISNVSREADAVLPSGAVIFFKQSGQMLEATYRGGPVQRGHILGRIEQDEISYHWHAYTHHDAILHGEGELRITSLPDGRRELREVGGEEATLATLVMREA